MASPSSRLGWFLVTVQFTLIVIILLLPRRGPTIWSLIVGGLVAALGIALAGWSFQILGRATTATPIPIPAAGLRTSGPYARIRHPIYSALLLLVIAWTLTWGTWPTATATFGLGLVLVAKARWEDRLLAAAYPDAWPTWAAGTGSFTPRLLRRRFAR